VPEPGLRKSKESTKWWRILRAVGGRIIPVACDIVVDKSGNFRVFSFFSEMA
jgi:hypothetical protein